MLHHILALATAAIHEEFSSDTTVTVKSISGHIAEPENDVNHATITLSYGEFRHREVDNYEVHGDLVVDCEVAVRADSEHDIYSYLLSIVSHVLTSLPHDMMENTQITLPDGDETEVKRADAAFFYRDTVGVSPIRDDVVPEHISCAIRFALGVVIGHNAWDPVVDPRTGKITSGPVFVIQGFPLLVPLKNVWATYQGDDTPTLIASKNYPDPDVT